MDVAISNAILYAQTIAVAIQEVPLQLLGPARNKNGSVEAMHVQIQLSMLQSWQQLCLEVAFSRRHHQGPPRAAVSPSKRETESKSANKSQKGVTALNLSRVGKSKHGAECVSLPTSYQLWAAAIAESFTGQRSPVFVSCSDIVEYPLGCTRPALRLGYSR
jgi:hypothetical protein